MAVIPIIKLLNWLLLSKCQILGENLSNSSVILGFSLTMKWLSESYLEVVACPLSLSEFFRCFFFFTYMLTGYSPIFIMREFFFYQGTQTAEKNELLKQFGISDYNMLPVMFRQGSSVFWDKVSLFSVFSSLHKQYFHSNYAFLTIFYPFPISNLRDSNARK